VRLTLKKNTKKKIAGNNGYRSPRRFAPRDDRKEKAPRDDKITVTALLFYSQRTNI